MRIPIFQVDAPTKGIPEDPVTGGAHCALTPYWGKGEAWPFEALPSWIAFPQTSNDCKSGRVLVLQLASDEWIVIINQEITFHQLGKVLLFADQTRMWHALAVESQHRLESVVIFGVFVGGLDLFA